MRIAALLLCCLLAAPANATTIACDGKTMASDSQVTWGTGIKVFYGITYGGGKIERIGNYIVGCAGDVSAIKQFKEWFRTQDPKSRPKITDPFQAIVMSTAGVWEFDNSLIPTPVSPPYAIGSGRELALGAMRAGAPARLAVQIAIDHDLYSGGGILELKP